MKCGHVGLKLVYCYLCFGTGILYVCSHTVPTLSWH